MSLKQQILRGVTRHVELEVPELACDPVGEDDGFDGVVLVRPLTEGELDEVETAELSGQVVHTKAKAAGKPGQVDKAQLGDADTDMVIDVAKSAKGQTLARRIAVAYGLSCDGETIKPSDVAKMPPAAVRRIHAKVMELTLPAGDVASFRGDGPGPADRDDAPAVQPADDDGS